MKNIINSSLRSATLGLVLATASIASAQTVTTQSTTTTSAGTVSSLSPDTMTIQSDSSSAPVNYSFSKTTTYVDENGNPVSTEVVRSGVPVTVYYTQDGDKMVASKVVVRKVTATSDVSAPVVEKKTTTTTTTTSSQ